MSTALVPTNGPAALALAAELGASLTATSLEISDPNLPFESWENLGRCIGFAGNAWQWWVGDWIRIGETLYGEEAAQAIDDPQSKYDIMRRVTGAEQQTLLNVASVARRVPPERRRGELRFGHHKVVAPLEADEQVKWLQAAIDGHWSISDLTAAIREASAPPVEDEAAVPTVLSGPSLSERLVEVAELLWATRQPMDGGQWAPDSSWNQLGVLLGKE